MKVQTKIQTSQNAIAQISKAPGNAITKPRAKLRLAPRGKERGPDTSALCASCFVILLSILMSDLLHLASRGQKFVSTGRRKFLRALTSRSLSRFKFEAPLRWLTDTARGLSDLALLFYLVFSGDAERRDAVCRTIITERGRPQSKRFGLVPRVAIFLLCAAMPRVAWAQDARVLTPIQLFDPEAGDGVRIAPSLVLHTQATVRIRYDSNVYNTEISKIDDGIIVLTPRFSLNSDFPRHGFRIDAGAEIRRYLDTPAENSEQYNIAAHGLLELGGRIDVEPQLGFARGIERRGTAGDLFTTDEPVVYHQKWAGFKISRTGGILGLTANGRITKWTYDNAFSGGNLIDLSSRNVTVLRGKLRAEMRLNERIGAFVELGGDKVEYEKQTTRLRDSSGYSLLGGVHLQITSLVDLEAALGYIHQTFDNPAYASVGRLNYSLVANWTPTPRWKVTASVARTVDPSPREDVPALVRSDFRIEAQYAVSDRLMLQADVAHTQEDYWSSPRTDRRYSGDFALHYRLTERIGIIGSAGYRKQDGGNFGRSYEGASVSIGVRAAW